jgi:hypothetical protein
MKTEKEPHTKTQRHEERNLDRINRIDRKTTENNLATKRRPPPPSDGRKAMEGRQEAQKRKRIHFNYK